MDGDCDRIREKFYELAYGLLDEAGRREVESHLARCDACRRERERVKRELALLHRWETPAPPEGLAEKAVRAAHAASRQKGDKIMALKPVEPEMRWLGGWRFWAAAAAAVVLVVACVSLNTWRVAVRHARPQEAVVLGHWDITPGVVTAYRVFVRDGRAGDPIADAEVAVKLVSPEGRAVWKGKGKTDERGIVEVVPDVPADLADGDYKLQVNAKSAKGASVVTREVSVSRSFRVMVSTDKPLYQPGQTIHIRTLALATADLRPVGGRRVTIEVQDAKGNKVFKKVGETSGFGIASGDFVLADQVNTGSYTVRAAVGETVSERSVTVDRYTLPKFRIDLKADKGFYEPGAVLTGDLSAQYTFGEPVAGAKVSIVASEFIEKFRPFAEATGETDAEGHYRLELPLKRDFVGQALKQGDAFASLEATVVDKAGHTLKKTLDVTVTTRPIRIEMLPESGTLVQNVENVLYILTAYPDGRPARTKLTIGATQQTLETSEAGIAKVNITPTTPGLRLTVTAEDETGLKARVSRQLNVGQRGDAFLLRTDKAVYRTGETAALTVLSAARKARVFLDVIKDRRTMLMTALDVADGRGELALDLPADLFGTLELRAYRILSDGNIIADTKVVQVNRAGDLKITAEMDKEVYRPAEKAIIKFAVTRGDGQPVQAALSLAGVDEAVYALSEMRPGLERVYFMLQEEILKPRYEIHARMPMVAEQTVDPQAEQPELQEASVVLFSGAEGSGPPDRQMSDTFHQKQARFRQEKDDYFEGLLAAGMLAPLGLFVLCALPILIYALGKLFSRRQIEGMSGGDRARLNGRMSSLTLWWVLAFYLPPCVFGAAALVAYTWGADEPQVWAFLPAGAAALAALVMLIIAAARLRRAPASRAVPLLRKFSALLAPAYVLALVAIACIIVAADENVIEEELATGAFGAIALLAVLVVPALSIGRNCALRRVSAGRWFYLALSRSLAAGCPVVAVLALASLPTLGRTRLSAERALGAKGGIGLRLQMGLDDFGGGEEAGVMFADKDVAWEREDERGVTEAETGEGGLKAPTRIRRHFPETLLWRPELITDEAGRARLELPLADSITTWRIAMSAVSARGELGAAAQGLRVFQDFFVDIDFPVALTQNDLVSVPVAVFNYLDRPQTVKLQAVAGDWCELVDEPTRIISLGARDVTSVRFRLRADKPGRHSLTVKAYGSEMADAVERSVMVRPDGKEFVETINGELSENLMHEIVIPEGAIDGASDLLVKIYPGSFSQVMEGLDSIFRMPSGCFEQTSSTTYPNVLVLDYMRRTKQVKPEIEMKAMNFINLGCQRLLSYEVEGGGFSWFGDAPAHNVLTAYGLMEFSDMAKVHNVDPAVIERTRDWLYSGQKGDGSWAPTAGGIAEGAINKFQGAVLRTTAYIAWALAESGQVDARLGRALDYLAAKAGGTDDPYTLALCANALATAKRSEARAVLNRLDGMKQQKDKLVWWTSAGEGATFSRGNVLEVETTALAAYAFIKANYRTQTAHKALAWLIERKDPSGTWHSTQPTVHAMRALLSGSGASGGVEEKMEVTVAANGELARELTVTPENSDVFQLISLRGMVRAGKNTIALETAGKGSLAYQIVATHYLPWPRGEAPAAAKEMTIDVDYDTTSLKAEDILTCRVTVQYNQPGTANMTIVDLGIPPGFDIIPDAFQALKDKGVIGRYSMTGRQAILYFEQIEGGAPVRFTYQLKAKFPVKVKTPPSTVYQYYEPDVRDEAAPVELEVIE